MKKLAFLLFIIGGFATALSAQAPQKINYQGTARNAAGQPIANQFIALRISILDSSALGTAVYAETFAITTNALGLYNVAIGNGTVISGNFNNINWALYDKFIKVEMDPAGGTSYVMLGTSQILSSPYALRAESAGKVYVYGGGTQNPHKMVIQHSPTYPNWGLQYNDTLDQFRFLAGGSKVMEVDLGSNSVHVSGNLKITSGGPGMNRILTSDASGNATWSDLSTRFSSFQPAGCQGVATATTNFQKLGNLGTFTKNSVSTVAEIILQTNIFAAIFTGSTGVIYEMRVDDNATSLGNATALLRNANSSEPVMITGIFQGLLTGTHTVSLWAKTASGTASTVYYDAGCFNSLGTNNVLIKEYR